MTINTFPLYEMLSVLYEMAFVRDFFICLKYNYYKLHLCKLFTIKMPNVSLFITIGYIRVGEVEVSHSPIPFLQSVPCGCRYKIKKV